MRLWKAFRRSTHRATPRSHTLYVAEAANNKASPAQSRRSLLLSDAYLKAFVGHLAEIAAVQIGHHNRVAAVIADIGLVDPNQTVVIQTHA